MQWGEVRDGKLALRPARHWGAEENLRPAGGGARHGGGTLGTGGRQTAKSLAALGHSSGRGCYYCFSSSLAQPWDIYVAPWLGSLPLLFYFFFLKKWPWKGNDGFQEFLSADYWSKWKSFQELVCFCIYLLPWKVYYVALNTSITIWFQNKTRKSHYWKQLKGRWGKGANGLPPHSGCVFWVPLSVDPPGDAW